MTKKTTILTGFLGAGKTTYLNYLLKSNTDKRFAIIENEFGEQSIDGDLILRTSDNIIETNNGCLCCTLNDNLYDLLNDLYLRRDKFDELIIEATGIADPAGIAEPFLTNPSVKDTFELVNTICLIDAEQIEDQLRETEEARKQVVFSDVLLIGKTDLVALTYVKELTQILQGINPFAEIVVKQDENYPLVTEKSKNHEHSHHEDSHVCNHKHDEKCNHHHQPGASKTHQHTDIVTHSFVFNELLDIDTLYQQLLVLVILQSKDIYRVKGIIFSTKSDDPYLVQSVGKRLSITPIESPVDSKGKESRIVFIGKNIKREGFQKLLDRCVVAVAKP
jgi:G3E family GTPase